jgi:serine/threonine protein kinase
MLEKDPIKRISLAEIFDHPWISAFRLEKR